MIILFKFDLKCQRNYFMTDPGYLFAERIKIDLDQLIPSLGKQIRGRAPTLHVCVRVLADCHAWLCKCMRKRQRNVFLMP